MGSVKMLLSITVLIGLISSSHQQNTAPVFLQRRNGFGIDGDLRERLTDVGILENSPIDTTIGSLSCTDDDTNGFIEKYEIDNSQTLRVEDNGKVILNRLLDREKDDPYLKIRFFCVDNTGLSGTAEVDITVIDINDNKPQFVNAPYQAFVNEDTAIDTRIYTGISIQDDDASANARVNVSCFWRPGDVEQRTACDSVRIETTQLAQGKYSASLYLNRQLDFEANPGFTVVLFAEDLPTQYPQRNSSVNFLITVVDTQDTPPQFLNVPLTIYVKENVAVGTPVELRISARDGDTGEPRPVDIRITDDKQGFFQLGSVSSIDNITFSASVIVNADIDREMLQGTYEFVVEAVEQYPNLTYTNDRTSATVRVDILDENDNLPTFSEAVYNISMFEIDSNDQNNYQIPQLSIQITDSDDPSNSQYDVVIADQSGSIFRVFPEERVTGNVAVNLLVINASLLDYDTPSLRYQRVILEAREYRPENRSLERTSTATVNIHLMDLNDNAPKLTSGNYRYSLPENADIGIEIARIQATDKDEGLNGRVTYALDGTGSEQFSINATTGVMTLARKLDYEKNKIYQILLIAKDSGNPVRETSRTITIDVTNINDEPPVPARYFYRTYAQETSLVLRPAVVVLAVDQDSSSRITYRIIAGNTLDQAFQVDSLSGVLTLANYLDFDNTPNRQGFFEIVIQVSDNDNPPLYANITVQVNVQDENNNEPIFERPNYDARVGELAPTGTSVVTVRATDMDKDENGRIRYMILSGGLEDFDIGERDGFISVSNKSKIDYINHPEYRMIVYAIDHGSPPKTGTTTVVVQVDDANNKSPRFTQQIYVISIAEATAIGTNVLDVTAIDPDSTANLTYSIPTNSVQARNSGGTVIDSQESTNAFVVNPNTGSITTNRTLSRQLYSDISFSVLVRDVNAENNQQQTASTSVLITILGTNVSTIYFTPARYYFSVTEGKQKGYTITTVAARDPACGNCLVTNYREVQNTDALGFLEVEQTTGRVSLSQPIDYENARARRLYMEIEATASDGRTARTNVVVEVRDDNDNSPKFRQNSYEYSVSEERRYPYRVGYVKAYDVDSGSFGRVEYSLSGQGASDFQIFESGLIVVSLTAALDYETTRMYNLLVTASDNPTNQTSTVRRQTSVLLQINVLDTNDNTPQFGAIYPFYIVENFKIGQRVGRIVATDGDSGTNGEIVFSMNDTRNLFRITDNGYILTQQSLRDMSPLSPFNVTVKAEDKGVPSKYNKTVVQIYVRSGQLNDGRPQWSIPRLGVSYYVNESYPLEQFVVQAKATARSSGPEVFYSFNTDSSDHMMFKVDRETGRVTTNGTFDREDKAVYDLILIATDQYNTSLQSYRGLTVRVRDENDNVPDFGRCPGVSLEVPQRVSIFENVPVDTFVYRVKACDLDEVLNGVTYSVETNNPMCVREMAGNYFEVSADGNITTNRLLDRETKPYHLVCVRASALNRRKRQADGFNRTEMTDTGRIAYVVISLMDINDNGPVFPVRSLFEVISSVPTERTVVRVKAVDPDQLPFNRVRYSIQRLVYFDQSQYETYDLPGSFIIGPDTGIVTTAFPSYGEFRIPDSYFNITIQAEDFLDPDKKDMINLYVYIFEPSQTIRVVIDKSPDDVRELAPEMIRELTEADPTSLYRLQQVSYHRVVDQYDVTRTDVCFVVVKNKKVLSVRESGNALSQTKLDEVLNKYGARTPGSCYRTRSSLDKIDWAPLWWVLVALAIFIFICCCILIVAVYILYGNYKKYMNTRKTYLVPQ